MSDDSVQKEDLPSVAEEPSTERAAFLHYPVSTMSPRIVPTDLTTFKTHGISKVQKDAAQRLVQLREQYMAVVDEFNWNKLVYESSFGYEPVVGEVYHLYRDTEAGGAATRLSMIGPGEWDKPYIASLRLNFGGQWELVEASPDFDLNRHIALIEAEAQQKALRE